MACLREVVLANGPTTYNASDSELVKLKAHREIFELTVHNFLDESVSSTEEAEKRRKAIQCHLLEIYRKQASVEEQASLPYTNEGRQKYLQMLEELTRLETMFDKRLIKIRNAPLSSRESWKASHVEQSSESNVSTNRLFYGCFKRSS